MPNLSIDPVDPAIRAQYAGKLYKLDPRSPDHGDGRELALLNYIHTHPCLSSIRNSPLNLRLAIDQFGIEEDFLMTTGALKLEIIASRLRATKPRVILEFGSYVGWGAAAFGGLLRELHSQAGAGEVKLFTFEANPLFAAITSSFVELSGLKDVVDVVVGPAENSVRRLVAEGRLGRADVVLLDHWEKLYLNDFQVMEELGVIGEGSLVIADNTVRAPEYVEYVQGGKGITGVDLRSETIESIMPMGVKDFIEITSLVKPLKHILLQSQT